MSVINHNHLGVIGLTRQGRRAAQVHYQALNVNPDPVSNHEHSLVVVVIILILVLVIILIIVRGPTVISHDHS